MKLLSEIKLGCPLCQSKWREKAYHLLVCPKECPIKLYLSYNQYDFGLYKQLPDGSEVIWYRNANQFAPVGRDKITLNFDPPFTVNAEQMKLYLTMS